MNNKYIRNVASDIVIIIFTLGIFSLYIQYKQSQALNDMLQRKKYKFLIWCLLCTISFGIYHVYHEVCKSLDIEKVLKRDNIKTDRLLSSPFFVLFTMCLCLAGLFIVVDAIQQAKINAYYRSKTLKNPLVS